MSILTSVFMNLDTVTLCPLEVDWHERSRLRERQRIRIFTFKLKCIRNATAAKPQYYLHDPDGACCTEPAAKPARNRSFISFSAC